MPSSHLILCRSLLFLPPIPPSSRVFSSESALHIRWPKYWSFSFSISPSSEHPGLVSFRMGWLDLLAVQGTLKSLLQHRSSKVWLFGHLLSTSLISILISRDGFAGATLSLEISTTLPPSCFPHRLFSAETTPSLWRQDNSASW